MSTLKLLSLALVVTAISVPALAEEMMMKKGEAMMMMPDGKMATMPMDKDDDDGDDEGRQAHGSLHGHGDGRRRQDGHNDGHEDVERHDGLRFDDEEIKRRFPSRSNAAGGRPESYGRFYA